MNYETAKREFDAISKGGGRFWDCKVLAKNGAFKAHCIQITQCETIAQSLQEIFCCTLREQKVFHLDLSKYSNKAVFEMLRFLYLSEAGDLTVVSGEMYLAEELLLLAKQMKMPKLQECCVEALYSHDIVVDKNNFLRLAQIGGELQVESLVQKCWYRFELEYRANPVRSLTEAHAHAPMFLKAIILQCNWHPDVPAAPDIVESNPEQGVIIEAHKCDDKLFAEVIASLSSTVTTEPNLTDFEIHCNDTPPDRPIRCHRNILARVPHFERMVLQDNKETRTGLVEIDAEKMVVIEVLRYIYSGISFDLGRVLPGTEGIPGSGVYISEKVIDLAQQYRLCELKHHCHEALLSCDINVFNIFRLIRITVLYELVELQNKCLRFFFQNRRTILTSEQWHTVDNTVLQIIINCVLSWNNSNIKFCVVSETKSSILTIDMNGTKSNEFEISGQPIYCSPLHQLDNRTVIVLMCDRKAQLFDLVDHTIIDCPCMLYDYRFGAACVFKGDLYVTGGTVPEEVLGNGKRCERYIRATNTWETIADLNESRGEHALVEWKGYLLAISVFVDGTSSSSQYEFYDALVNRWYITKDKVDLDPSACTGVSLNYPTASLRINNELWLLSTKSYYCIWKTSLDVVLPLPLPLPANLCCLPYLFERAGRAHLVGFVKSQSLDVDQFTTKVFQVDEESNMCREILDVSDAAPYFSHSVVPCVIPIYSK